MCEPIMENRQNIEIEKNIDNGMDIEHRSSITWLDLHDDCWEKVFSYLKLKDKLTVTKVCQRWRKLIMSSTWHGIRSLNFTLQNHELYIRIILPRCCRYITEIAFSMRIPTDYLQVLATSCTKLRKLSLTKTFECCETVLSQIFQANPGLVEFRIHNNCEFIGRCLKYLNVNSLETLEIKRCPGLVISYVKQLDMFVNLKELILDYHDDKNFKEIGTNYLFPSNLQTLWLTKVDSHHSNVLMMIVLLRNLQSLKLSYVPGLTDRLLCSIARNCPDLRNVGIIACDSVSDIGILSILQLQNLSTLQICGLYRVTDIALRSRMPPKLTSLNIGMCLATTSEAVKYLIHNNRSLNCVRSPTLADLVRGENDKWYYVDSATGCVMKNAIE